MGKFRFFSRAPFMLDFSRTTLSQRVERRASSTSTTLIQSKDNIKWPNSLGILFNTNHEISSTIPASQRFCIKAFNPNPVTFTGTAEGLAGGTFVAWTRSYLPTNDATSRTTG